MTSTRRLFLLPLTVLLALLIPLTACGSPTPAPVTPISYAAGICVGPEVPDDLEDLVDRDIVRKPDSHCRVGDSLPGDENYWVFTDTTDAPDLDVSYVGYPIIISQDYGHSRWSRSRPVYVTTLNIQRGSFAERPSTSLPGVAPATSVKVPTASAIKRGGLGVPANRAQGAPGPSGNVSLGARPQTAPQSAPAGNTGAKAPAAKSVAPKSIGSAPSGNRTSGSSFKASSPPARSGKR